MRKKNIIIIMNCILSIHPISIYAQKDTSSINEDRIEFHILLKAINLEIDGNWDPPVKLYGTKDFLTLYNDALKYIPESKNVMREKKYTEDEKMICVYINQKLPDSSYLSFSKFCLALVNSGDLSEGILMKIILPYEWKTELRFVNSYKEPEVKDFLLNVMRCRRLSSINKNLIRYIYNGKLFLERQKMSQAGFDY